MMLLRRFQKDRILRNKLMISLARSRKYQIELVELQNGLANSHIFQKLQVKNMKVCRLQSISLYPQLTASERSKTSEGKETFRQVVAQSTILPTSHHEAKYTQRHHLNLRALNFPSFGSRYLEKQPILLRNTVPYRKFQKKSDCHFAFIQEEL